MAYSILEITDGTYANTVTLIAEGYGIHLKEWNPSLPPFKQGGVFQSSSLAGGSIPVIAEFDDAVEAFSLAVNGPGMDATIRQTQDLIRLLQEAIYYWLTGKGKPIYLKAKSPCETGTRYAHLKFYGIPNVDNPYASPFFVGRKLATMDDFELTVTRGHWLANAPGTGECLTISSIQTWSEGQTLMAEDIGTARQIVDMVEAANGDLFISALTLALGNVLRSQDGGSTWGTVNTAGAAQSQYMIRRAANGYLYLGRDGDVQRSTDNGATWASVVNMTDEVWGFCELANGTLFVGDSAGDIRSSSDNGATWDVAALVGLFGFTWDLFVDSNDYIYAVAGLRIYRSTDAGTTWHQIYIAPSGYGLGGRMIETANGLYVAFDGAILNSTDAGQTWVPVFLTGFASRAGNLYNLHMAHVGDSTLYALYDTAVYGSFDGGLTWANVFTDTFDNNRLLYVDSSNQVWVGEIDALDNALWLLGGDSITFGATGSDCTLPAQVYLSNKYVETQLTHIKISDGGAFTDLMPMTSLPTDLYPAAPAQNDAIYFISSTDSPNSGQFDNVVFFLSETFGFTASTSLTIVWEYWDGAAWSTLTVTDGTAEFSRFGIASVHWVPPSDWATTTVDSVVGWAVRARISTAISGMTPPAQGTRAIYTANRGFLETDSLIVEGDIPALARYQLFNRSDEDGRSGSGPDLWDNRIIAGLRSFAGTNYFRAYINISDVQAPYGITVSLGTNTSFAADNTAPTGRRAVYNPAGVEAMATRATITLGPAVARDFYGTFHAYARAQRTAGSSTDLTLRLQVVTGSGGITFTSESVQLQTTTAFELLDFGQVELPVSGGIKDTELPDTTQIIIQASAASGTPDLYLYDLILIPVDEWAIDAVDFTNSADSVIGQVDAGIYRLLDVDSIAFPLLDIRSLVRQDDSDQLIVAAYDPITSGEAIAQNNTDQRLWVLCAQTAATGTDPDWIAPPAIAHSIKAYKNERWLALRGDE